MCPHAQLLCLGNQSLAKFECLGAAALCEAKGACCRVVVASTGKRCAQQLTGVDGDVIGLEGNGWVIVRTSDGSETLRIQQRYLCKQSKDMDCEV